MPITSRLVGSAAVALLATVGLVPNTPASARSGDRTVLRATSNGLLAFQETDPTTGVPTIATVRLGRTHPHLLTPGAQSEHADWTPDGRSVVYDDGGALDPPDGHVHLFRVDVHGGTPTQLTSGDGDQGLPSVDPTGRYVAFDGNWPDSSAAGFHSGVGVVDLRTGAQHEITRNPFDRCGGPCTDGNPAWSPDGGLIAFVRSQGNSSSLVTVRPDGSHLRTLTDRSTMAANPDWSPTGDRLVFNDQDNGGTDTRAENIWVIHRNGGPARPLTHNQPGSDASFQPTWSPDGGRIAFVHYHLGDAGTQLFDMSAAGRGQRDLEIDAPLMFSPAWGPSIR